MSSEKLHVPSLLQLLLSGLGLMILIPAVFGLAVFGLVSAAANPLQSQPDVLGLFSLAWIAAFVCLLLIPSLGYALLRLMGKQVNFPRLRKPLRAASGLMLFWPVLLAAGVWLSQQAAAAWLFLPPIQVLVVAMPLWWFVELGRRNFSDSPAPQRMWGVLSFGLLVNLPLIITLEMIVLGLIMVPVFFLLGTRPDLVEQLSMLAQRLVNTQADMEALLRIIRPVLRQPGVVAGVLGIAAGLMPLLEELFKPLPLWFLARRKLSPAEGFAGGMVCGAAFALLESLISISPLAGEWALLAVGRAGTGLLHVVTTGLVGWGLSQAWSQGKFLKLAAAFLISASFHGIWNIFGILLGVGPVARFPLDTTVGRLSVVAPLALLILTFILFALLVGANRVIFLESAQHDSAN